MPTPQALESLKILMGNRGGQQVLPGSAYGFAGSVPTQGELESPFEQEQAQRAAAADAADRAAIAKIQATNADVTEYNRPDVSAVRNEELANALKMKLEPIRLQGQYNVAGMQARANNQAQRDERLFNNSLAKQNDAQAALDARAAANAKATGVRQSIASQMAAKQREMAKASDFHGLGSWLGMGGPSAKDKLQAEINALAAQLGSAEMNPEEAPDMTGGAPPVATPGVRRYNPATGRIE